MAWVKRNLIFVIIVAIGLIGTGYCGYLAYTAVGANAAAKAEYDTALTQLQTLQSANPPATRENIDAAKADQERVRTFLTDFKKAFTPFPTGQTNIDEKGFADQLQLTLRQWAREATNAGVEIQPDYAFSFSQQRGSMNYSLDCIPTWLQEIEDIRVVLRILFTAKINYFESIQRIPACGDEGAGGDLIQTSSVSNQWGVITPYRVTFRGFSTELANVLTGFADSTNCFIVKYVYVTPSRVPLPTIAATPEQPAPQTFMAAPEYGNPFDESGEGGGRRGYRRRMPQQQQQIIIAQPTAPAPPAIVLQETPLYITLVVDAVNLKKSEK